MTDDDCEDQGIGTIADGCTNCATWVGGTRYPHPLVVVDGFWKCEGCGGSYGPSEAEVTVG
ncbi:MAG: hypothetical protein LLG14_27340 [Nocardiaceae bacterium]|nr:hypothetical protein [Nocardiaceae bacterium]